MEKPHRELYPKLAVVALIVAYIALSVASSFATRLRYGPDEPAHFIYVREIGEHLRMPALSHQETHEVSLHSSHEAHQPPLYYIIAAVPYFISSSLGADIDTTWRILRLFTVLFGAGWVYFLYRLSREFLGGRRYAAVLAAACVGLLPSATYIGGVVNNDALACMTFTAALWSMFKSLRRGAMSRRAAIEIGAISGLAILTKAQGMFLLPVAAAAGLLIARRSRWKASMPVLSGTALAILTALVVSAAWFIRNWYVYGSPVIQSLHNPLVLQYGDLGFEGWLVLFRLVTDELFKYFWTPFWLLREFVNPERYARLLLALCFLVMVGLLVHLRGCRRRKTGELNCRPDAWALLALPGLMIYVFLFRHTLFVDRGALQQGRLLLPAAAVFGIGLVMGFEAIVRRPAVRAAFGVLLAIGLVVANLVVLRAIVAFYEIF
jgi:4-amino-4-deoxy-L-arabinose transferase-like glycosyltransferase